METAIGGFPGGAASEPGGETELGGTLLLPSKSKHCSWWSRRRTDSPSASTANASSTRMPWTGISPTANRRARMLNLSFDFI